MKTAYPIRITETEGGYVVYIPDFDTGTQGDTLAEAMEMARDAIGLLGITMEDEKQPLPAPSPLEKVRLSAEDALCTLVDVDFEEYRRMNDLRTVRKNCTLPAWLDYQAEKAGLNFSQALQYGLKVWLHLPV